MKKMIQKMKKEFRAMSKVRRMNALVWAVLTPVMLFYVVYLSKDEPFYRLGFNIFTYGVMGVSTGIIFDVLIKDVTEWNF